MRILVTGGAGFVGSNLAKRLESKEGGGHEVVVLDNFSSGDFRNLVAFHGDVRAADCSDEPGGGPYEIIFHQASITDTTVVDQSFMMGNNVESFRRVLGWAVRWKSRVIWASSAATYGNLAAPNRVTDTPRPLNVYGYSKLAMERLAARWTQATGRPMIGLRYFNVYGPGEAHKGKFASMIYQLAQQMKAGKRPRVFKFGEQKRDFVSIEDVLQANLRAMKSDQAGVYNVGCGRAATFNEVIAGLNAALGTKLEPEYFDNPYDFFQNHTEADISETAQVLGYQPRFAQVGDGIQQYQASGAL